MSKIFMSYRRDDSRLMCDRIYERLQQAFGRQNVFRDIDNIPAGVVWPDYIDAAFAQCKVALVLIGPTWLTLADEAGRRLDNPQDRVRLEIETALHRTIPIIPVLLQETRMPSTEQLPESLQKLTMFNSRHVRPDPDFRHDMEELIVGVSRYVPLAATGAIPRRVLIGAAAGVAVTAVGALVAARGNLFAGPSLSGSPVANASSTSSSTSGATATSAALPTATSAQTSGGGPGPAPTATPIPLTYQASWRWCSKCYALFYSGFNTGVCPAGGSHDTSLSKNYFLLYNSPKPPGAQDQWHWCNKCQGLYFYGFGLGACPAGGQHGNVQSQNYILLTSAGADGSYTYQSGWLWCSKCYGTFYSPFGNGVCPAGGKHDGSASQLNYTLAYR